MPDHLPRSRKSAYVTYSKVWDRFAEELVTSGHRHAIAIAQSWETSKNKYAKFLDDAASKVTRSHIGAGMKQGLRGLPLMLSDCPAEVREPLLEALVTIIREEAPEFFQEDSRRLSRVLKKGQIRGESEFYLVRHRVDEIEGQEEHRDELAALYKLLDQFEGTQ